MIRLIVIILLFGFNSYSQNYFVGLKLGMIYPMYSLSITKHYNGQEYDVQDNISYSYGALIEYKFSKKLSISLESSYEKHKLVFDTYIYRYKPYQIEINNKIQYDYFDIPLVLRYYYKNTGIFFNLGASCIIRLNSNVNTTTPSGNILGPENANYNNNSTLMNYGGIVGLGYMIHLNNRLKLTFELRDRQILNNQFTPYGIEKNIKIQSNTISINSMLKMNL